MRNSALAAAILTAALSLPATRTSAGNSVIRDVDISVTLAADGSAHICEVWDMAAYSGTEMYLVRENLGEKAISNLAVSDGDGALFGYIGRWDAGASFEQKSGRCGIVSKSDGCEICWGLGSYGDHIFRVEYDMSCVVKSLDDFDALHIQFVSPGIVPYPQHVRVTLRASGLELDEGNSAVWAFGYEGTDSFEDGGIVLETTVPFSSDDFSVILLARFDKGLFTPVSVGEGPFQDILETAMYGSSYEQFLKQQKRDRWLTAICLVFVCGGLVLVVLAVVLSIRQRNLHLFGVTRLGKIGWSRDIPFGGNLYQSQYVLRKSGWTGCDNALASAMILRMIYGNVLTVVSSGGSNVEIAFNADADLSGLDSCERKLYDMMKAAAGSDSILQKREFSRWSKSHRQEVADWFTGVEGKARSDISLDGFALASGLSPEGQANARAVIGFRKYLKDFTLVGEKQTREAVLWREYLVFAALYGIADAVARQLEEIDPRAFEEYVGYPPVVMNRVIFLSDSVGSGIISAVTVGQTSDSVGGRGGFSSFGGGGGFSGGGFGGGVR